MIVQSDFTEKYYFYQSIQISNQGISFTACTIYINIRVIIHYSIHYNYKITENSLRVVHGMDYCNNILILIIYIFFHF